MKRATHTAVVQQASPLQAPLGAVVTRFGHAHDSVSSLSACIFMSRRTILTWTHDDPDMKFIMHSRFGNIMHCAWT